MTMIAGFQESGIPILMGDVLLTGQNGWKGLRKKIHKVSPNLAVSWTGHLQAAQIVLKDLRQFQHGRKMSKVDLEGFLTTYPTSDLASMEVHIVGWIIDIIPHCFLWNSAWPHEIFYDYFHFDGSGAELLEQVDWTGSESGSSTSGEEDIACGTRRVTDLIGRLLAEEMIGQNLQQFGFGHAYEFLYFAETEFKYMPQTLFAIFQLNMDIDGSLTSISLNGTQYKIEVISDETIVQIHTALDNTTRMEIISNVWTKNPFDSSELREYLENLKQIHIRDKGYRFSFESEYYGFLLYFVETNISRTLTNLPIVPMSFEKGASGEYFKIEEIEDSVLFSFSESFKGFLENIYRDIRSNI